MEKVITTCHCCLEEKLESSSPLNPGPLKELGWGVIFYISNGLEVKPFCPKCFLVIKEKYQELDSLIKIDNWSAPHLKKAKG